MKKTILTVITFIVVIIITLLCNTITTDTPSIYSYHNTNNDKSIDITINGLHDINNLKFYCATYDLNDKLIGITPEEIKDTTINYHLEPFDKMFIKRLFIFDENKQGIIYKETFKNEDETNE